MEQLMILLQRIQNLLEQVLQITDNQQSILLQPMKEDKGLGMLEEMAKYKEGLTTQVEETEQVFQKQYNQYKDQLAKTEQGKNMRVYVERILAIKEQIISTEQKNVMLLKEKLRTCVMPMTIQPSANRVAQMYKVQEVYGKGKSVMR